MLQADRSEAEPKSYSAVVIEKLKAHLGLDDLSGKRIAVVFNVGNTIWFAYSRLHHLLEKYAANGSAL